MVDKHVLKTNTETKNLRSLLVTKTEHRLSIFYIYKSRGPRKKNPQQQQRKRCRN